MSVAPTLLVAAFALGNLAAQDPDTGRLGRRLEHVAAETVRDQDLQGLAGAVSVGGEVLFSVTFGTTHHIGTPCAVELDTRWPAASLVEQLTVLAVLQLASEGALDLDDPVSRHLPGLEWEGRTVTLHHLLGHTSGIAAYEALPSRATDAGVLVQTPLERLIGEPLESPPGHCLAFSSSNALLLGRIVERLEEKPLEAVLAARIVAPVGLSGTRFQSGLAEHLGVRGVRHDVAGWLEVDGDGAGRFSAGDLCTTVPDLLRLVAAIANRTVVDEARHARLTAEHRYDDGAPAGFGYGLNDVELSEVAGHAFGGAIEDHWLHVAWYPELDVAVALVADAPAADLAELERRLVRVTFGLRGPRVEDFELTEEELAIYAGTYMIGCNQVVVRRAAGRLELSGSERPTYLLLYQGRDVFVAAEDEDVRLYFSVERGRARGFVLEERGQRTDAQRID